MALQIIAGSATKGKTYYVNHKILDESLMHPDIMYYVVVPEQLNLSMQQYFLEISKSHTLFNIDVVSFERLADRIISRCGILPPNLVDDTGKCLLLRKVAEDVSANLTVLKRPVKKPGFIQLLKSTLSELLQYDVTDKKLEELSAEKNMPAGLGGKLRDVLLLYRAFNNAMENDIPKENLLSYVNGLLPGSEHIKNSVFLFDGFTGFSPRQMQLVESILAMSKMVYVTAVIDRETINKSQVDCFELFYMGQIMINGLCKCAENAKTKVLSPIILEENQRSNKRDLRFLEENIFRSNQRFYEDSLENIRVMEMENPLQETRCVAEEIYHLVSAGYRYGDIAVITGNMDTYIPHITRVFDQAGFAYFMDNKKDIHNTPVVSYILSAFAVIKENADYESMFTFLKTGIVLSSDEYSILDNYVLAKGIRGFSAWEKEWKKETRNMYGYTMQDINGFREKAIKNLMQFRKVLLQGESTVLDVLTALVTMMQADDVFGYIEEKRNWYAKQGAMVWENLYAQLYAKVLDVLEQFVQTLGTRKLSPLEYHDILVAGFAEIKAGTIPATSDCILVGDMERTRVERIKVLFFMGLSEGDIPDLDSKVDLLNKREREILSKDYNLELAPSSESKQSFQKYYFYLTVTKPSDYLYLSYPETNNQGSSVNPSIYLKEMQRIFPLIENTYETSGKYAINDATMLDIFASELQNVRKKGMTQRFKEISGDLWSRDQNRSIMAEMINRNFFIYEPESVSAICAQALYGEIVQASATRLETAAGCPFSHFLKYGLGVIERDIFEVSQKDIGSVYHMVLERFFKSAKESNTDWMEMPDLEREGRIKCCMDEISEAYKGSLFRSTAKNRYFSRRICDVLNHTVDILSKQVKMAGYSVKDVEVSFTGNELDNLNIPLDNKGRMILSGRVDRLDIKKGDENILYAKVVDYKTGNTTFDATLAYNGLSLQLIYMDAAKAMVEQENPDMEVHTGGFAYYHIKDQYVETTGVESTEQLEKKMLKDMEMTGLINLAAEPDASSGVDEATLLAIQKRVKHEAERLGNKIIHGDVEVSPYRRGDYTACTYCPYKAACGVDFALQGYSYRFLKEVSRSDFNSELD